MRATSGKGRSTDEEVSRKSPSWLQVPSVRIQESALGPVPADHQGNSPRNPHSSGVHEPLCKFSPTEKRQSLHWKDLQVPKCASLGLSVLGVCAQRMAPERRERSSILRVGGNAAGCGDGVCVCVCVCVCLDTLEALRQYNIKKSSSSRMRKTWVWILILPRITSCVKLKKLLLLWNLKFLICKMRVIIMPASRLLWEPEQQMPWGLQSHGRVPGTSCVLKASRLLSPSKNLRHTCVCVCVCACRQHRTFFTTIIYESLKIFKEGSMHKNTELNTTSGALKMDSKFMLKN